MSLANPKSGPTKREFFHFQGAHLPYNLQGSSRQKSHPKGNDAVILSIGVGAKTVMKTVALRSGDGRI